jgi:hypothetical protein
MKTELSMNYTTIAHLNVDNTSEGEKALHTAGQGTDGVGLSPKKEGAVDRIPLNYKAAFMWDVWGLSRVDYSPLQPLTPPPPT